MGRPAATRGDLVTATDTHLIITPPGPVIMVPHPFVGVIDGALSEDVRIAGQPAATVGSTARNDPPHIPIGGSFAVQPANLGTISVGSATVRINGKPAARAGDLVMTCNDPVDLPVGTIIATRTVLIGD